VNFIKNKKEENILRIIEMYAQQTERTQMQGKSLIICLKILRDLILLPDLAHSNILDRQFDTTTLPLLPNTPFFTA
jgi:hypothetical protein